MKNYDKIVGANLKRLRKEIGLTQAELADFLDKSLRTVQKYESGDISMSISLLKYFAEQFEVELDVFFECDYSNKTVLFVEIDKGDK